MGKRQDEISSLERRLLSSIVMDDLTLAGLLLRGYALIGRFSKAVPFPEAFAPTAAKESRAASARVLQDIAAKAEGINGRERVYLERLASAFEGQDDGSRINVRRQRAGELSQEMMHFEWIRRIDDLRGNGISGKKLTIDAAIDVLRGELRAEYHVDPPAAETIRRVWKRKRKIFNR